MKYLVDTNIIIDYLRDYIPTVALVDKLLIETSAEVYLSAISNLELRLGSSIMEEAVQEKINAFIARCYIIDITLDVAVMAGDLKRERKADISDALIAASCIINDLTLVTRNRKHFKDIPMLKIYPFP